MTRDHFEALAEAIRDAKLPDDAGADAQRLGIADAVASVCETYNKQFNRDKFIRACKL